MSIMCSRGKQYMQLYIHDFNPVHSKIYSSPHCPRFVLDRLALLGYRVTCSAGVGQTCIWTLYADSPDVPHNQ